MNILFMNNVKGPGIYGIERWMLAMAEQLRQIGHRPLLAARRDSDLLRAAQAQGLPCLPFRLHAGFGWIDALRLRRFLKRERIDGVLAKNYKHLRVAARARTGLPVALLCRRGASGDVADTWRHRLALGGADGIVVPSAALQKEFCRAPWLDAKRVFVMPHEIDVAAAAATPPVAGLPPCACRVVFAGRLAPIKGTDVLLRAWRAVQPQAPEARLLLVGDSEGVDYRRMAEELGIADSVDFAGFQADAKPWIAAAGLLVLPSRSEGAGFVLLEAMALGLPCVGSRVGGIPEYIAEGETGRLVPPDEVEALAAALMELIHDPDRRRQMGEAARRRVRERFSAGQGAIQLIGIFERLRAERARA
jgi:glycosyltransferase involved in cell wall biosynthesis